MKVIHIFANTELESRGIRFIETLKRNDIKYGKLLRKENQFYVSFVFNSVKELLSLEYNWIHAHRISGYIPAIIAKILKPKIRIIYDKHDIHRLDFIFDRLTFFSKEVFVCSKIHLEKMKRFTKNVNLMPNYSNFKPLSRNKKIKIRDKIGLDQKDVFILFQGSIVRDYGLDTLIESMSKIKNKNVKVGIIGWIKDVNYWNSLKENLGKNIFYLGSKDFSEMNDYVGAADIGVVLFKKSRLTTFGNPGKLFEFISCKIPLIVSDVDSVSRYIRKFNNGKIISTEGNLRDAILELSKLNQRKKYSKNSPLLKWSDVGKEYIHILKDGKRRKNKRIF